MAKVIYQSIIREDAEKTRGSFQNWVLSNFTERVHQRTEMQKEIRQEIWSEVGIWHFRDLYVSNRHPGVVWRSRVHNDFIECNIFPLEKRPLRKKFGSLRNLHGEVTPHQQDYAMSSFFMNVTAFVGTNKQLRKRKHRGKTSHLDCSQNECVEGLEFRL